jgi:hypothetical protein
MILVLLKGYIKHGVWELNKDKATYAIRLSEDYKIHDDCHNEVDFINYNLSYTLLYITE